MLEPPAPRDPAAMSAGGPDGLDLSVGLADELATIYATAPIGLALIDRELRFVRINARLAEMNGAPVHAHLGRSVREMVPDLTAQAERLLRQVVDTGTPQRDVEVSGETPALPGVKRTWIETWSPVRDAAGSIVGVSVVAEEVTALRHATEAAARRERELARIAEHVPVIIARFDRALRHVFANPAIESATGRATAEVLGRTHRELGEPPSLCERWESALRAAFDGARRTLESCRAVPGGARHFEWLLVPEADDAGRVETVLSVAHDVTERVEAADALRETNRRKDEFLATLSHELRNPLAPLRTCLRVIQRHELADEARRAAAMCARQVSHMTRLVDDLLEVSRISRGQIRLRRERVMVAAAIRAVIDAMGTAFQDRDQHLHLEMPAAAFWADVDPTRFAQIVENLLSNASKYTGAGGTITLSARAEGDTVVIAVRDTGIGIAADELQQVFDPFRQLAAGSAHAQGGLGIGLALVRQLTQAHGGTVAAASDGPGRGATFTVVMPAAGASPPV